MLPLLVVSDDTDRQNSFFQELIEKNNYKPFNVYKVVPLKTELGIDQIRAVKREIVTVTPHPRLFGLYLFDTASLEAQNAFLKTLEEKNEVNQFVLFVSDIGRVIPTILSRSKIVALDTHKNIKNLNNAVSNMLQNIEQKRDFAFLPETSAINREDAIKLFDHIILSLEEQVKEGNFRATTSLKKALNQKSLLINNNLNPQLAVDSFLLFYRKISLSSK